MHKSKRLLELMMTVNRKKRFTVQELADEFNVSYRTILRDLQELSELGVPLYSEVGVHGGYSILNERVLPPITFTENEAVAMFFAYQSLQYYGSLPFAAESEAALRKFYHFLPPDTQKQIDRMRDRIVFWQPEREHPDGVLRILLDAAVRQSCVQIDYDSAGGTASRRIQPIGLYTYNGFWFCPAYCFERAAVRLFRIDRVLRAAPAEEQEGARELEATTLQDYLRDDLDDEKKDMPLHVRFTREGVRRIRSDLSLGHLVRVHDEGTGEINTWVPSRKTEYIASLLFALGTDADVQTPPQVIDRICQKAQSLLRHYNKEAP